MQLSDSTFRPRLLGPARDCAQTNQTYIGLAQNGWQTCAADITDISCLPHVDYFISPQTLMAPAVAISILSMYSFYSHHLLWYFGRHRFMNPPPSQLNDILIALYNGGLTPATFFALLLNSSSTLDEGIGIGFVNELVHILDAAYCYDPIIRFIPYVIFSHAYLSGPRNASRTQHG